MHKKVVLLITFRFPPMGGVGTRRIVKFAKYLTKQGYQVHVLTVKYPYVDTVNWLSDTENNENIIVHRIKAGIPLFLLREFKTKFIQRLQYLYFLPFKKTFYYLDHAQRWGKYLIPAAIKILDKYDIKNVLVTNPPVTVAYQAAILKTIKPDINLIQDFRDSWNDDIRYAYPKTLSFVQKEKSVHMENFVIQKADSIITTTGQTKRRISTSHKYLSNKFKCIYNGYDNDDYQSLKIDNSHFNCIYAGSLGVGRDKGLHLLLDGILELDDDYINNHFTLNVFSEYTKDDLPQKYQGLIDKNIFFHNKVKPNILVWQLAKHSYCLSINALIYPYAIGAKTFDYMGLNKKIILVSPLGELYTLLKQSNQFVSDYDLDEMKKCLLLVKQDFLYKHSNQPTEFHHYDLQVLIKQLEELL